MDEIYGMATLFDSKAVDESVEVSPIERLLNAFEVHEAKEDKSIEQYRAAMSGVRNPMTRFLLQIIIADEEKHRAVIHAMVATLKGSLTWTKPEGSLEGTADFAMTSRRLRETTDEFIELERNGIEQFETLMDQSRGYYHGVFKILLDSMVRDSEKHIKLLEFLKESIDR